MPQKKQTKNRVTVDLATKTRFNKTHQNWLHRLFALGDFLIESAEPNECVNIYAYEDATIGGVRIAEVDFTKQIDTAMSGSSYMRNEAPEMTLRCEEFLSTFGEKPYKPEGWESFINEHGESRLHVLRAMGIDKKTVDAEYQRQLDEENKIN